MRKRCLNPNHHAEIKKLIEEKELSQKEIGDMYNTSQSNISHIKNKKTWVGV
jgi:predicted XRE-type DNA-binding protein